MDVEKKLISWFMGSQPVFEAFARDLKPGGYFGIHMRYERNTKFDDVSITILEQDPRGI